MRSVHSHRVGFIGVALAGLLIGCSGCASTPTTGTTQQPIGDAVGRTYYIDGAGNWGYGVIEVTEGLRRAGYRGQVIVWHWSPTFNPALDQTVGRPFARSRGKELGNEINAYCRKYPGNEVNIIALSAGTGVATWACEAVTPPARVNSMILLGSSISSDYDVRQALEHITGGIWVYYSRGDQILLGPVRTLGTIDGKMGIDGAGLIGLHPKSVTTDKIHNISWSAQFERFGWTGAHTDATSEPFVRNVLSRHIVALPAPEAPVVKPTGTAQAAAATAGASTQPAADVPASRPSLLSRR